MRFFNDLWLMSMNFFHYFNRNNNHGQNLHDIEEAQIQNRSIVNSISKSNTGIHISLLSGFKNMTAAVEIPMRGMIKQRTDFQS